MSAGPLTEFYDPQEDYRSVEPLAVLGLVLGIVSAIAMFGGPLWIVAGVAAVVNILALRRLGHDANRSGRGAALAGLALSVMFVVAPGAQMIASRLILARQAREVADQFFEFLREQSPEKAMMLRFAPDKRLPFGEAIWTYFRNNQESRGHLRQFVATPTVRTILTLGPKAEIRYYKTNRVATQGSRGLVDYYYTVTYPDGNKKKTFLVDVLLERKPTVESGINPWRVVDIVGGFDPATGPPKED